MKLTFAGTRGFIEARTRRHAMHTALDVAYKTDRVRIDCGADWRGLVTSLAATAIVVTHAHPDHAEGLRDGAPCPVYATQASWEVMRGYAVADRREVTAREPFDVGSIRLEAFPVIHSTRTPAVGYRISAGRVTVFYAPDLVTIDDRTAALSGIKL